MKENYEKLTLETIGNGAAASAAARAAAGKEVYLKILNYGLEILN